MSKAPVVKEEKAVAVTVSSMFEEDAGKGMENMGQEDLALPFLKVLSGNDPVLDENDKARKGDIYNTVTGQLYKGSDGINVIPCAYQRRFIEWSPRGEGSGAPINIFEPNQERPKTERSPDDNKEYVVGGTGSYIEETHQHFVVVQNEDGSAETALIAMKSTQLKKSRKWNSMMQSVQMQGANGPFTPPRYSHVYHIKTIKEENSKGSWHGWEMSRVKQVDSVGTYTQCKSFAESITAGDVVVKHSDESAETNSDIPF
jgi:hypothetical protein|tara:strand:- start:436 stop:1209 length:774 start_codon:yes stop_codon:yes gene_type:complete